MFDEWYDTPMPDVWDVDAARTQAGGPRREAPGEHRHDRAGRGAAKPLFVAPTVNFQYRREAGQGVAQAPVVTSEYVNIAYPTLRSVAFDAIVEFGFLMEERSAVLASCGATVPRMAQLCDSAAYQTLMSWSNVAEAIWPTQIDDREAEGLNARVQECRQAGQQRVAELEAIQRASGSAEQIAAAQAAVDAAQAPLAAARAARDEFEARRAGPDHARVIAARQQPVRAIVQLAAHNVRPGPAEAEARVRTLRWCPQRESLLRTSFAEHARRVTHYMEHAQIHHARRSLLFLATLPREIAQLVRPAVEAQGLSQLGDVTAYIQQALTQIEDPNFRFLRELWAVCTGAARPPQPRTRESDPPRTDRRDPARPKREVQPQKAAPPRSGTRLCFNCGTEGHLARDCPAAKKTHAVSAVEEDPNRVFAPKAPASTALIQLEDYLGTRCPVLVDTGAAQSCMTRTMACTLGLPIVPRPNPVTLTPSGRARAEKATLQVVVNLALTADAEPMPVAFAITECIPGDQYALLALPDLRGYAIQPHNPEFVIWLGMVEPHDGAEWDDMPDIPVCAVAASEANFGDVLDADQKSAVQAIINKHNEVFEVLSKEPAAVEPLRLSWEKPVEGKTMYLAARLSPQKAQAVTEQIKQWLDLGLIEPATNPRMVAPVVVVAKSDGSSRICQAYNLTVNQFVTRDVFPIPSVEEITTFVSGKPYLAAFDLRSGFYQFAIHPEDRPWLAFVTDDGVFQPTRMPFGFRNAANWCQRYMSNILSDVIHHTRVYIDDIVLATATFEEFCAALTQTLGLLRAANVRLGMHKTRIGFAEAQVLGRRVNEDSIMVDLTKVEPWQWAACPKDRDELCSLLGTIQWYGSFIPVRAELEKPLRALTVKGAPFRWGPEQQKAWDTFKTLITNPIHLAQPKRDRVQRLRTDASDYALAGVLLQEEKEAEWRPVAFMSRKLTQAETKYTTTEKEALAIVSALQRLKNLANRRIVIETDHRNLQWMQHSSSPRVQRWNILLSEYEFVVLYLPGHKNHVADFLSRCVPTDTKMTAAIHAAEEPRQPISTLRALWTELLSSQACEVSDDGRTHLSCKPPAEILEGIMAMAHDDLLGGHRGVDATLATIQNVVTWPQLREDVRTHVRECAVCQKMRAKPREVSPGTTMAETPFESIYIDCFGPLPESNGYKHVLCMVDRFSAWTVLAPVKNLSAEDLAMAFWVHWIGGVGAYPRMITSDGAKAFTSGLFEAFLTELKVTHHVSAPGHPEGHGMVEMRNATAQTIMAIEFKDRPSWDKWLPAVQFVLNTSLSAIRGASPFEVLHGTKPRTLLAATLGLPLKVTDKGPWEVAHELAVRRTALAAQVREAQKAAYEKVRAAYARADNQKPLAPGDLVLVRHNQAPKLQHRWTGPFRVVAPVPDLNAIWILKNLVNGYEFRCSESQIADFRCGALRTEDELRLEATAAGEGHIDRVEAHDYINEKLWFLVHWEGKDTYNSETPVQWVEYANCRYSPAVKSYLQAHPKIKATPRIGASAKSRRGKGGSVVSV